MSGRGNHGSAWPSLNIPKLLSLCLSKAGELPQAGMAEGVKTKEGTECMDYNLI